MATGAVACCGGKMNTHKKCIFFIIIGIIYSLVPLFGENKEEFHTKTVKYSEGTLELYVSTKEGRTTPDYYISFTEDGDNWMTIDTIVFTNQNDSDLVDIVKCFYFVIHRSSEQPDIHGPQPHPVLHPG